jgi:tripartite-type tricarboxylate transporter receptor subunit TctC
MPPIRKVVDQPDVKQRFTELGGEPMAGTPAEMASHVNAAIEKWKAVAKARDIKGE